VAEQDHLVVKEAEALIVGPDEKLIIHFPETTEYTDEMVEDLNQILIKMGLGERTLILIGDVEFAKLRD
jgi:hypothetical protein